MYSVIASIKSTAPAQMPSSSAAPANERSNGQPNGQPKFPVSDFLKMLGTALAAGVGTGMVAAAVAMLLSQVAA